MSTPSGSVLTVDVVRLDGADGQPLSPARFRRRDLPAVLEVLEEVPATDGAIVSSKLAALETDRAQRLLEMQRHQVIAEIEEIERIEQELAAFKSESIKNEESTGVLGYRQLQVTITNNTPYTVLNAEYSVRVHSPGREVPWAEGEALSRFEGGLNPGERATSSTYPSFLSRVPFKKRNDIEIGLDLLRLYDADDETLVERAQNSKARLAALRQILPLI